jgi:DNA-binding GntR family transcriptional regulator
MPAVADLLLPAAPRVSLADSVADSLREAIFRGQLTPEQRLSEAQIAASMRVSRAPVRDALAQLEQEGLLTRPAGRGVVVRLLAHQDVDEICSLRLALESLALQRAVRFATPEDFAQMADAVEAARHPPGPAELAGADLRFHEAIVRAARHERLFAGWWNLRSQIRLLLIQRNLADASTLRGTAPSHAAVLKAIRARDERRALALLREQLEDQYTWFLNTFPTPARQP